jgi:hypothetical protein
MPPFVLRADGLVVFPSIKGVRAVVHCRPPNMNPAKPDCLNDEKVRALQTNQPTHISFITLISLSLSLSFVLWFIAHLPLSFF